MNRRRFLGCAALSLLASCVAIACSSKSPLIGKWQVVRDDGSESGTFHEFLEGGTLITSTNSFTSSFVYVIVDSSRMKWTSDKTNSSEVISFRFEGGYLYLKDAGGDREVKHKRVKG